MYVAEEMLLMSETILQVFSSIVSIFTKLQPFSMSFPIMQLTEGVVHLANVETFWEKKIIGKFSANIC